MAGIINRIRRRMRDAQRRRRFRASVRHVHGPVDLKGGPQDVLVIALIRDGSYYLDAFFDHYRRLGVTQFAFFDNGSTDDSIARIMDEPGTVIDSSPLPLAGYEDLIRQYAAFAYGQGRWVLYADMDEIFDFPASDRLGLPGLVSYLSSQGHTALMAQMLEMFPDVPLRDAETWPYAQVLREFRHYETRSARWVPYHDVPFAALLSTNQLPAPEPQFAFGGVRGRVFGENCCLTKHPLVFMGTDVVPAPHPHCASGVSVSDLQAVLKHYKFANHALARDRAAAVDKSVDHGENIQRSNVLQRNPDVSLMSPDAQVWEGVEPLYADGFVRLSPGWRARAE